MTFTPIGIGLIVYAIGFTIIGAACGYLVQKSGKRYIVCGKSLPFFLVGTMLIAQAVDANSTMGGAALAYGGGLWGGFTLSLGLGLCLVITGKFFARPLNQMNLLTLPDFYRRRYGPLVEIFVSILMGISFIILIAGNFAGTGWLTSIALNVDYVWAMIFISIVISICIMSGGLYSCAATDVVQIYPAAVALIGSFLYLLYEHGWAFFSSAIPAHFLGLSGLTSVEHGALVNWAGILALGLGDVIALDFTERVFSAKNPREASRACYYSSVWTVAIGFSCTMMGMMGLKLLPNITNVRMILPTIALESLPLALGIGLMGGIMAAGTSTANGGILAVSTVLGRNIYQKNILQWYARRQCRVTGQREEISPKAIADQKLLRISRAMGVPVVLAGMWLAYVKPEPGVLLILAFDVVFAGCLVPLALGIYWRKANTPGALAAILLGSVLRFVLQFAMPERWAGLETMIPPVVSLIAMVLVSLLTQEKYPANHGVVGVAVDDELVLAGLA